MPRKPWEKQESRLADLTGGRRQPGSGSGWVRKHDVRSRAHLIEAKHTDGKGYRITLDELRHLEHNAALDNRTPVFVIEFGRGVRSHRYVVLRQEDYFPDDPFLPHGPAVSVSDEDEGDDPQPLRC